MSTRIVWDPQEQVAALYDSVSGVAFGEVFTGEESYEHAERFLDWLNVDPRKLPPNLLAAARAKFLDEHPLISA